MGITLMPMLSLQKRTNEQSDERKGQAWVKEERQPQWAFSPFEYATSTGIPQQFRPELASGGEERFPRILDDQVAHFESETLVRRTIPSPIIGVFFIGVGVEDNPVSAVKLLSPSLFQFPV